ncbi:type VI secretion system tip protein TssI/VgrG [Botrimarina sp.]|uniref:type VI secretion system Vgr family protein n=1 Tax=Botrimarina sp. TaxID=2795802 RepID=UPI0032EEB07B
MSDPDCSETLDDAARPVRFDSPGCEATLFVTRVLGVEELCRPFRLELSLLADDGAIDFADVLGKSARLTVELPGQSERHWHGLVTRFAQTGQDERHAFYEATVEPPLVQLGLRSDCRIFQDQKVDDVLDTLLTGLATRSDCTKSDARQPRNYCVQYRETDLDFLHRLIEEAGLFYFFEHDESGCTMVLADDSTQLDDTGGASPLAYRYTEGGVQSGPSIKQWRKTQRLTPTSATVRDTHFQKPREAFESLQSTPDDFAVGKATHKPSPAGVSYPWYAFPGGYAARYDSVGNHQQDPDPAGFEKSPIQFVPTDADAAARLECERFVCRAIQIDAESDALSLAAGAVLRLDGHPTDDDRYLVRRVEHHLTIGDAQSEPLGGSLSYRNTIECQPVAVPYRPQRVTPKPTIAGVQTAMVVADATDNESDPKKLRSQLYDKYGRVKVWFPWDRREEKPAEGEPPDAAAGPTDRSCWVRVAQVWAGKRWGAFFWPRHGNEVLVAFEHGDPDRPVIVGSVYNAENMPPMEMPSQQDLTGIKSCSVAGDPSVDFNGLTFYDEIGNEHVEIHSEAHTVNHNEHSEHVFTRGSSVRVRGRLFGGLDSGSGGGPKQAATRVEKKAVVTKAKKGTSEQSKKPPVKKSDAVKKRADEQHPPATKKAVSKVPPGSQQAGKKTVDKAAPKSAAPVEKKVAPSADRDPQAAEPKPTQAAGPASGAEREEPPKRSNLFASKASETKNWDKLLAALGYEADIEVTLGNAASVVTGMPWGTTGEIVTGGSMSMVIDPSGWLDEGVIAKVQDLVVPLGDWSALFGAGRSLHYGPLTTVHHGREIERRSSQTYDASNPRTAWVGGIITASAAMSLLAWRKEKSDPKAWETYVRKLGPRGLCGMLLNLLLEFEKANGETDAGEEKQREASSLNDQVDALGASYKSLLLDLAGKATETGSALASEGASDLADQQAEADSADTSVDDTEQRAADDDSQSDDSGGEADAAANDSDAAPDDNAPDTSNLTYGDSDADVFESYDGLLATGARHISLRARSLDDDDTDASLVHIDAQGGDGEDNGVVAINSTGQATIVCGPAAFQIRRDGETGQIDATTGDDGSITFTTGGESGSKAVMTPDGITLSVGAEGSGAVITMTSDGIKLAVGPDGGPCLELTTSGVTMSTGANSVAVDQSGQTTSATNISHEAQVAFEGKGVMASLEASAQATVKGTITMIN